MPIETEFAGKLRPHLHRVRLTGTKYFLHHSQYDRNVTVRWAHCAQAFVRSVGEVCELRCWDIDRNLSE
jgi:hypothetical protein